MKKIILLIIILITGFLFAEFPDGNEILDKIDKNIFSNSSVTTVQMIIHGKRFSKTMKIKTWTKDGKDSFSEYLYPPSDKGTKMLKLDDKLWIYNRSADRIIPISGHMLRQSVMGSDLSYEDFMENKTLRNAYNAEVIADEIVFERDCWILQMTAVTSDVAYVTRKIWVDKERFIALKEELYGKSGKLLKKTDIPEVFKVQDRWYPKKMIFKDMLKSGKGTELIIDAIEFDVKIPKVKFSKAALN